LGPLEQMAGDAYGLSRSEGRRYEAVFRLSEALSVCPEPEDLTKILSEQLREFIAFLQFYIIIYKENSAEVEWAVVGREKSLASAYADVPLEQRPSWRAYTTQEPFHIHDWSTDERVPARLKQGIAAQGLEVGPLVFVPLTTPHRRLGALGMSGPPGTVYSGEDISFLRLIGRVVAFAIDDNFNLRRAEVAQRELQCQNERLQRSERELREVIETIPTMAWSAAADGPAEFFNGRWLAYAGLTADQAQGWGWTVAVHPDDLNVLVNYWRALMASGRSGESEARLRRFDGVYRWFLFRATPSLDDKGTVVKWYGTNTDIEERKRAEQALRRSEAYLAEAQRLTHTGSCAIDGKSRGTLYWSEEMFRLFGFDQEQGLPMWDQWFQRIHPEDRDKVKLAGDRTFLKKVDCDIEFRIVRPDGTVKQIHGIGHPVLSPHGELVQVVGTMVDITERRRAEEKIQQSEKELRQLLDFTPQHVTVLGPDRRRLYNNQAALDYHGLTLEEWQTADPDRLFHPQDWERITREVYSKFLSGSSLDIEVRLRRRDGQYRWFLIRYSPTLDEQGRPTHWYAAATDIEERKQAEQRLQDENVALREEIDRASMFEEIVGISPALHAVLSRVTKVAPTDSTVLITGETGTGKELVARAIHRRSQRSSRAFVSVNCAAIPRDLIASELFGHEKGAFTGATQRRLGRFELAEGGTIFLDEVGELPAETQIALLRVLQEHEFGRVGGTGSIRTNVRVIAATNRDLEAAFAAGTFRSDLFYRLNVFPIEVPPLRERKEDIPLLVQYFLNRYASEAGKSIRGVNKKSLELLQSYPWPGNIRELQNVIERSVIVCDTENFSVDASWLSRQPPASEPKTQVELLRKPAAKEKEIIEAALRESRGRVYGPSGAASKLGIPRSTLESKIRSLKISKSRFKAIDSSKNS
jgi:PAS domain S-box-containing protein